MRYFIHTDLKIKYGSFPKLVEAMETLVPFLGTQGWRLDGAYQAIVGNFNLVTHIWEVETLESIPTAMAAVQSTPHVLEAVADFKDYVLEENLQLVTRTPYCP